MQRDRILRLALLVLAATFAAGNGMQPAASTRATVPNTGPTSSAAPTAAPMRTPNATQIAQGFLTIAADPDSGPAPLTVVIVASYIGPYGSGFCGGGPSIPLTNSATAHATSSPHPVVPWRHPPRARRRRLPCSGRRMG